MFGHFIILFIALYFLPSIVAMARMHKNKTAVIATNILLGWTAIGWIAAMIWAVMDSQSQRKRVEKQ